MIRLRPDCLAFKAPNGEATPASVEQVTLELAGEAAAVLDETILQNVGEGVLHYFKEELGQETVTAQAFAEALEKALQALGFDVKTSAATSPSIPGPSASKAPPRRIADADLNGLAAEAGGALELVFFPRLRAEVQRHLDNAPHVLRFHGLRACVKRLVGARRWTPRCQGLNDQIVDYLRSCLSAERRRHSCAMVVL